MSHNQLQSLQHYELVKFQPRSIILRSRLDRKLYSYHEDLSSPNPEAIDYPILVKPILLETGALFECGYMTLQQLLDNSTSPTQLQYTEVEIKNTLSPVLQALSAIHTSGLIHGSLSPSAVFIDDFGEVKVFFPAPMKAARDYYTQSETSRKSQDFKAFALIAINLIRGKHISEDPIEVLKLLARNSHSPFTDSFLLQLYIMLTEKTEHLAYAVENFENLSSALPSELQTIYNTCLLGKVQPLRRHTEKAEFTPPMVKHSHPHMSPRKVLQMTRKVLKVEDLQNKKIGEEHKKKKCYDTALKKMSNCKFEGENTTMPGYKKILRDLRETKEREDLFKTSAVKMKRMRTISKKKLN